MYHMRSGRESRAEYTRFEDPENIYSIIDIYRDCIGNTLPNKTDELSALISGTFLIPFLSSLLEETDNRPPDLSIILSIHNEIVLQQLHLFRTTSCFSGPSQ